MSNPKMPDMGALMRQAQKMQADVAKAQDEVAKMTADGQAGGGMVTVTVNGTFDLVKIKVDKNVVDPNDIGMLDRHDNLNTLARLDQQPDIGDEGGRRALVRWHLPDECARERDQLSEHCQRPARGKAARCRRRNVLACGNAVLEKVMC